VYESQEDMWFTDDMCPSGRAVRNHVEQPQAPQTAADPNV